MIPGNEYPRPQFVRASWTNLNGEWDFDFDFGKSGVEREFYKEHDYAEKITVPFCPESRLSGLAHTDFIPAVWYRRSFTLAEVPAGMRLLLHFEAVDHETAVWVNGEKAGTHTGGYTPFTFDITKLVRAGENTLCVYAEDDARSSHQPRGKQCEHYFSAVCDYTRTTGIWQTVWMEWVPETYLERVKADPDIDNSVIRFTAFIKGFGKKRLTAEVSFSGKTVGKKTVCASGNIVSFSVDLDELHLWDLADPALYDVRFTLTDERGRADTVDSYFGMRSITLSENAMLLNGKPVFQRLVLDQGFYPDSIYTAPDDEALVRDIKLSMAMGFNGARLHQRVFERRFLYHADRMGYLVWGEYGNWGLNHADPTALKYYLLPWAESVERDYNSPALVGWCPFNETWDIDGHRQDDALLYNVYKMTKEMDPYRPVIDTSGNYHVATDIYDVHDYEQDTEEFAAHYEPMKTGGPVHDAHTKRQSYGGQPYFVSEYGGICWNPEEREKGWGYGKAPRSLREFEDRFIGLTRTLLDNPRICALCYTQLYDIEQEKNGLYFYDRTPKFSADMIRRLHDAMAGEAAIEKTEP